MDKLKYNLDITRIGLKNSNFDITRIWSIGEGIWASLNSAEYHSYQELC